MTPEEFHGSRRFARTPSGRIAYVERGSGPAALFVHGVPLNGYHWRCQLAELSGLRRCIAPDLMGLGYTEVDSSQGLDFEAQANMLLELMDALDIETFDLVGNDSGGAISQILTTTAPGRVRTLTLTNCDVHDNWPPKAFASTLDLARAGQLGLAMSMLRSQPEMARSPNGLGAAFQYAERLAPEILEVYLGPIAATTERQQQLNKYVASFDCSQTLKIHDKLKALATPTLIVWGDDDVFFPVQWAHWLGETLSGARRVVELKGARLFFPEERSQEFTPLLREHWLAPT